MGTNVGAINIQINSTESLGSHSMGICGCLGNHIPESSNIY